jgi:predicted negative regulator of RcsB-dependent stress response
MKSERRHELQHNQLADWIAKTAAKIAPYKNLILGVTLLVVVGVIVIIWQVGQSRAQTAEAWEQFYTAMSGTGGMPNLSALQDVIDKYPKTQVGHCAALASADLHLNAGCNRLFDKKATAQQDLKKAVENYKLVLADCRNTSMREQAAFGLARAHEALGELTDAKERYEEYLKMRLVQAQFKGSLDDAMPKIREAELAGRQWPEGAYVKAALLRLQDLKRPETEDFYKQFAKFDPKPAFSEEPGAPGKRPSPDLTEPAESGLLLPRDQRPGGDGLLLDGPGVKPSTAEKTKTEVVPDEPKPAPEPDAKKTAAEADKTE